MENGPLMNDQFMGELRWMHPIADADVWFGGKRFPTVVHAMTASKLYNAEWYDKLVKMAPWEAIQEGNKIEDTPTWLGLRRGYMHFFNQQKFGVIKTPATTEKALSYAMKLLSTGDQELVYWNDNHENFWGRCRCWEHYDLPDSDNQLGRVLMEVRELIKEKAPQVLDLDSRICKCGHPAIGRILYTKAWSNPTEVFCANCQEEMEQFCFDESSDGKIDIFNWSSSTNTDPIINKQVLDKGERTEYTPPVKTFVPRIEVSKVEIVLPSKEDKWKPLTLKRGKFLPNS